MYVSRNVSKAGVSEDDTSDEGVLEGDVLKEGAFKDEVCADMVNSFLSFGLEVWYNSIEDYNA